MQVKAIAVRIARDREEAEFADRFLWRLDRAAGGGHAFGAKALVSARASVRPSTAS